MQRREFLAAASAPLVLSAQATARPNVLWLTCEDISPNLACYGDKFAQSPALDALAAKGVKYRHAWSNAPVCAPARTTIISGMYPPSTGSEHMRSETILAPGQKMFPQILREAGYYTSNNQKEDYNLAHTGKVWDESSNQAHWRKREKGQPFFSVFNYTITHESQIRRRPHTLRHDPKEVRVPAFQPDLPEVRRDWAQYYDNIVTMDGQVKAALAELEADGLANDTIVMFYGDHGAGMPRYKRWPYESGCRVPLIAYIPEKFKHLAPKDYVVGGWSDRMVGFVDLAPTVLSMAGIRKAEYHQGHAFLGQFTEDGPEYLHGFRGRMDERVDFVRSVRSRRYVYMRGYMPHRIYGQHIGYMFEMPTTQVWKKAHEEGKTNKAQSVFWEPKASEELYDLQADPDEINNLAGSPAHQKILEEHRSVLKAHAAKIRDVGFLPEHEIHARAGKEAPYTMARDPRRFPMEKIQAAAELATAEKLAPIGELTKLLADADSAVAYWGATGLLRHGAKALPGASAALLKAMDNTNAPNAAIVAGEIFGRFGSPAQQKAAIEKLLDYADCQKHNAYLAVAAMNALSEVGAGKLKAYRNRILELPKEDEKVPLRSRSYTARLIEYLDTITA
jgi:uncharacterized sulfatase